MSESPTGASAWWRLGLARIELKRGLKCIGNLPEIVYRCGAGRLSGIAFGRVADDLGWQAILEPNGASDTRPMLLRCLTAWNSVRGSLVPRT
ncbi:MAG: hypothetical protein F4X97_08330 [Boseongicola sp. SB0662_bin_57]|nr:hypothetical protein [Boseongicola sp. SB0662_bin_57]